MIELTSQHVPPAGFVLHVDATAPERIPSHLEMTREQVFDLIQAHLADELDVDPESIERGDALQG